MTGIDVIPLDAEGPFADTVALGGLVVGRLVELPLQDGGAILVQVDEAVADPAIRGLGDRRLVTEQAQQCFEQAIALVQPAAQALVSRLRALADATK